MSNVIQRLRVFRQDYCGRWQHQEKKKKKKDKHLSSHYFFKNVFDQLHTGVQRKKKGHKY